MQPLPIVERLQLLKDRVSSLSATLIGLAIDTLRFQSAEEALHKRIIITIPFATHADHDAIPSQQRLVVRSGLLAAPV